MSTPAGDSRSTQDQATSTDLIAVQQRRQPVALTRFGGNTDVAPTSGIRKALYDHGVNVGATAGEIIKNTLAECIDLREELWLSNPGPLCIGDISPKGGVGKSIHANLQAQLFLKMNPQKERPVLIDINTSQTNLDELNGIPKEHFLTGRYWTMKTLYDFLARHPDLNELQIDEISRKMAHRRDPQLPVIPLLLKPSEFGSQEAVLTGDQYEFVLRILKRFFTVIVHDFGTELKNELTQRALSHMHILAVLTHSGLATVKMVPGTLEALHLNLPHVLRNTTVIFNLIDYPSPAVRRAIVKEKTGRSLEPNRLLQAAKLASDEKQVATPGQALRIINSVIQIEKIIQPLDHDDIVLVGFDPHLDRESDLRLDEVSEEVQAQLWMALRHMLQTRLEFERAYTARFSPGRIMHRDGMVLKPPARGEASVTP